MKKLENEKKNLIEDKTEMREKMDAMEDERRTLHETIQQLKQKGVNHSEFRLVRPPSEFLSFLFFSHSRPRIKKIKINTFVQEIKNFIRCLFRVLFNLQF